MAMMIPYGERVTPDDRTVAARPLMRPRPAGRTLRIVVASLLAVWFALPLVPLLLWSVANRWSAPAALPTEWGLDGLAAAVTAGAVPAFGRSLLLGLVVAAVATPLGAMAARALARGAVPAPRLVSGILLAPLALPAFVAVMGLTIVLLRARVPGLIGVVILLVAAALPYTVYTMRVAYAAHDLAYEEEARTLGASRAHVLWRVHLPLVAPGLARAAFLAFLVGWSDYVVTVLVGGGTIVTLPLLVASFAGGVGNDAVVAVLSLSAIVPPLVLLLGLGRFGRRYPTARYLTGPTASRSPKGAP
jgi:putative spermidine/putrescine transport system permease protein